MALNKDIEIDKGDLNVMAAQIRALWPVYGPRGLAVC